MSGQAKRRYDVVIIGSGLGGLACGAVLAKEGYNVCLLERCNQIGGTLQTFSRDKIIFDSGVHYVGGLEKGQNLYQLFKYLGIMDKLKLRKMDEEVFDAVMINGDEKVYRHAQGYERFIKTLVEDFPCEEDAIRTYCDKIKEVCSKFPLYNLRTGNYFEKVGVLEIDTQTYIESVTSNKKLQNVLAGNNILYAGESRKTPFYVHALVVNSYIESSWRFIDGGSQIARLLAKEITSRGGVVKKSQEVVKLVEEDKKLVYAETTQGERFYGDLFISNVHPAQTLEMVKSDMIKKAFRSRIKGLENSISFFYVNLVLKKDCFEYKNYNYYYYDHPDVWDAVTYTEEEWPKAYAMFFSLSAKTDKFAEAVTLMTYMRFDDVKKWADTFNTAWQEESRGDEYEEFKKLYTEKLLDRVEKKFPCFRDCIKSYYVATPLTMRDYIGTDDGSLYGVTKDYREPMRSFISPRTKIPNLYLTGQNLNLHGVLGVTVSAIVTCSEILGRDYLIDRIHHA